MNSYFRQKLAAYHLSQGVIAHSTDTVCGLACLPSNNSALCRLLALKKRSINKGFILLASDLNYLLPYISPSITPTILEKLKQISAHPTTYLVPASENTSSFLTGKFTTVAVRLTNNTLIKNLCEATGSALVSTSANIQNRASATSILQLKLFFHNHLDFILTPTNPSRQPSKIIDLLTGERYR